MDEDALGGEMGKNIDKTFIQSKMLNKSKGPAVHSLRAQADKAEYSMEMRKKNCITLNDGFAIHNIFLRIFLSCALHAQVKKHQIFYFALNFSQIQ